LSQACCQRWEPVMSGFCGAAGEAVGALAALAGFWPDDPGGDCPAIGPQA